MAILTQNDLNIFCEKYGELPWDFEGMTYETYKAYYLGQSKPPSLYSLAAKSLQKQLSPQFPYPANKDPKNWPMGLIKPIQFLKEKKTAIPKAPKADIPLLSSYAVRTA